MHRRRGRTVGTLIIGAIIVASMIYAAFAGLSSTAMQTPFVIAAAEPLGVSLIQAAEFVQDLQLVRSLQWASPR